MEIKRSGSKWLSVSYRDEHLQLEEIFEIGGYWNDTTDYADTLYRSRDGVRYFLKQEQHDSIVSPIGDQPKNLRVSFSPISLCDATKWFVQEMVKDKQFRREFLRAIGVADAKRIKRKQSKAP